MKSLPFALSRLLLLLEENRSAHPMLSTHHTTMRQPIRPEGATSGPMPYSLQMLVVSGILY